MSDAVANEQTPRLFFSDDDIRQVGQGLLDRTLPLAAWTHEAHLAACTWIICERGDIIAEMALPTAIRAYNIAVGGSNDDTQGYHETITQVYIHAIRCHLATIAQDMQLLEKVNSLLQSERGKRDYLFKFYSKDLLFSVEARRCHVAPNILPLEKLA
jgi:hypothetical protein